MKKAMVLGVSLVAFLVGAGQAQEKITFEDLFKGPSLQGDRAIQLKLSPDGERVTFLRGKADDPDQLDLWQYELASGEESILVDSNVLLGGEEEEISEEEFTRRQRQRIMFNGIVSYFWAPDSGALIFPLSGDVYYKPLDGEARRLTETEAAETDIRISPKGSYVSYIRDFNLYVYNLSDGQEYTLTTGGTKESPWGVADFIAQEELDRDTGYWWAPDESYIALTHVDQSMVNRIDRIDMAGDGSVTTTEDFYPFAGGRNADVELAIVPPTGGDIQMLGIEADNDSYLARVNWTPDSQQIVAQMLPRDQQSLDLVAVDVATMERTLLLRDQSEYWINLTHDLTFLDDGRFLRTSERTGYRHIYLHGVDGTLIRQLTSGDWVVDAIQSVDEEAGVVYFTGFKDTPLEAHAYKVSINGGEVTRLTEPGSEHAVVFPDSDSSIFLDTASNPTMPPNVALRDSDGDMIRWIVENPLDEDHPATRFMAAKPSVEFGTMTAETGETLYYEILKPHDFDPDKIYPALIFTYGGPHSQRVQRDWSYEMREALVSAGFVMMTLDNRGSWNRGLEFEGHLYRNMGSVEQDDQVLAARWLAEQPYVDGSRMGIYGWSYGGYNTLMTMLRYPGVFKAGFAGAPVTDWRLYDTGYTERYMGLPQDEEEAYERSSPLNLADNLEDELLLIHGMSDDNVFFTNSIQMMYRLQQSGKSFELMTYPGERHGFRDPEAQIHLWNTVLDFFKRKLGEAE